MNATIVWKDGTTSDCSAEKIKGIWLIGGDRPDMEIIDKIFISSKGKIYLLKGNRLIFQDNDDQ